MRARSAPRTRIRRLLPAALLALSGVVLLALGTPYALGGFTTKVTNATNSAASGIFGTTCAAAAKADNAYFVYPLDESSGATTARDVSGNNRPGTYVGSGFGYDTDGPCPRDGAGSITFTNNGAGFVRGATSANNPQIFSEEIWFNTTTGQGGKLIGVGNAATGDSSQFDRHVYMTNAGKLIFGVYNGGYDTITSPKSYNDGKWHQVVATLAPSGGVVGLRLYVDGAQVAADATTTSAESVGTPSWRIGYDTLNGWPSAPSNSFFRGSVAFASVYTAALAAARVKAHYDAGR